eukprot:COSAG04_NODE_3841_length_2482_cov_4.036928_3_plen_171_part_00
MGNGCQGTSNYLPLPAGWVLAPNDAISIAVVAAHLWSTGCAVLADGTAWYSGSGGSCYTNNCPDDNCLATSGGTYTVTDCDSPWPQRVLARCGAGPVPCSTLPAVDGMTIEYSDGQEFDSVATYSCTAAGYVPGGDATRTCLVDGSWDGTAPACLVRLQPLKTRWTQLWI